MDKNATESTKSYCKLAKKKQKKKYTVKYIIKLLDRYELSLWLFLPWLLLFLIQFCAFFARQRTPVDMKPLLSCRPGNRFWRRSRKRPPFCRRFRGDFSLLRGFEKVIIVSISLWMLTLGWACLIVFLFSFCYYNVSRGLFLCTLCEKKSFISLGYNEFYPVGSEHLFFKKWKKQSSNETRPNKS